jgi:hypothetical protein
LTNQRKDVAMKLIAQFEHTDTFGGEANYSWVRRHTHEFDENTDTKEIVRAARKWAGFEHVPCLTLDMCEVIEVRPIDQTLCEVVFVSFGE